MGVLLISLCVLLQAGMQAVIRVQTPLVKVLAQNIGVKRTQQGFYYLHLHLIKVNSKKQAVEIGLSWNYFFTITLLLILNSFN